MVPDASVTALRSLGRAVAAGYSSGRIVLWHDWNKALCHPMSSVYTCAGHAGGTLALSFAVVDMTMLLVSAGADGRACIWSDGLRRLCAHELPRTGATSGPHGVLLEALAADGHVWVTAVARSGVVGSLHDKDQAPTILEPLAHAVDAVQLLPDGTIALASYGGVTLFCREQPNVHPHKYCYLRSDPLPAVPSCLSMPTLPFNGWARSPSSSPDGAWLAGHVAAAGRQKPSLWLWRTRDGADFECAGLSAPISAMCWSSGADLLATCAGRALSVWRFDRGGPAGSPPLRLLLEEGVVLRSAAFSTSGESLACGTNDGQVLCIAVRQTEQSGRMTASSIEVVKQWRPGWKAAAAAATSWHLSMASINSLLYVPAGSVGSKCTGNIGEAEGDLLVVGLESGKLLAWHTESGTAIAISATSTGVVTADITIRSSGETPEQIVVHGREDDLAKELCTSDRTKRQRCSSYSMP